ncbi:hypothetical protein C8T65DRAFT_701232 [Cerioporus squamosus]|nr:hypothetical protein C8T65DRAFT_701232 [Cerioporus squamosus]
MPLPPSSPFSDASGSTIHTVRERACTLSGHSCASALSATSSMRKRDREREADAIRALARHVRYKPPCTISLDDIAARTEHPALLPRTLPQLQCNPSSSTPARPQTPDPDLKEDKDEGKYALWQNMPSSPAAPEPVARSERDLVRYGSRRLTLEYACTREMVGRKEREKVDRVHGEKEPRHALNYPSRQRPCRTEDTSNGIEHAPASDLQGRWPPAERMLPPSRYLASLATPPHPAHAVLLYPTLAAPLQSRSDEAPTSDLLGTSCASSASLPYPDYHH